MLRAMPTSTASRPLPLFLCLILFGAAMPASCAKPGRGARAEQPVALGAAKDAVVRKLVAKHGEKERARIERGAAQVESFWRSGDGDAAAY